MFNVLEARDDDLARAEKTLMRLAVSRDDALERWFLLPGKKIKIKNRLDYCRMVAYRARDDRVRAVDCAEKFLAFKEFSHEAEACRFVGTPAPHEYFHFVFSQFDDFFR